mmetsp:Transcript_45201/g.105706  ORF Transcript_45201/g.105706 Transcript_45201/m.105706 type:complete len:215 (-) Transcript_45201:785-1429(-)
MVWRLELLVAGFDPIGSHVCLHISTLHVLREEEAGLSVQACTKEEHEIGMPESGQGPDLMEQLVPCNLDCRVASFLRTAWIEAGSPHILNSFCHHLQPTPRGQVNCTLDGCGQTLSELYLRGDNRPVLKRCHGLERLEVCVFLTSSLIQNVSSCCSQRPDHRCIVVLESLVHWCLAKGIVSCRISLRTKQHADHLCVSTGCSYVQRCATIVVGR